MDDFPFSPNPMIWPPLPDGEMSDPLMADGRPLNRDDPRLEHFKRVEIEGELDPRNPAAYLVPLDDEAREAAESLLLQGISRDSAFAGLIRSTLYLNMFSRRFGRNSLAVREKKEAGDAD